jgi:Bacterial Ig domain
MIADLYGWSGLASIFRCLQLVGLVVLSTVLLNACSTTIVLEPCSTFAKDGKSFQVSIEPPTLILHPKDSSDIAISVSLVEEGGKNPEVLSCQPNWTVSEENLVTTTQTEDGTTITVSDNKIGIVKVTAAVTVNNTTSSDSVWVAVVPENSEEDKPTLNNDSPVAARSVKLGTFEGPTDNGKVVTGLLSKASDSDWYYVDIPAANVFLVELGQSLDIPSDAPFKAPDLATQSAIYAVKGSGATGELIAPQAVSEEQLEKIGDENIPLFNRTDDTLTVYIKVAQPLDSKADMIPYHLLVTAKEDGPVGNTAPIADNDEFVDVKQATPTDLDILDGDKDPDGGHLLPSTIAIVEGPFNGSLAKNEDGTLLLKDGMPSYTSKPTFEGTDIFRYTVKDSRGAVSNKATVLIRVVKPPSANVPTSSSSTR